MDFEKRARRQNFRVIISETIMVLTVIIMVAVLAFVVSGYWVNANGEVERQGMLQVSSLPTGANVAVDGNSPWYQRTNTSKVLSSGEHHIVLTRDGYDTWEKTVNISEGLLYRLQYPRLFLLSRERESVYDVVNATFATVSKDNTTMLLANNTTTWTLLNLENDKIEPKPLDISPYFTFVSLATGAKTGLFTGEITSVQWSGDNAHLLVEATATSDTGIATEWVLLDVKTPKNSVNLTREFATTFTEMRIFDNSASTLLALRNGSLHRIDVSARQISATLVREVAFYDFYDQDIVFVDAKGLGLYRSGEATYPELTAAVDTTTHAYLSRFYDNKYLTVITGSQLAIYKMDEFIEFAIAELDFVPEQTKVGQSGDFIFMNTGTAVATFDMESQSLTTWTLDAPTHHWLDNHMLYTVAAGALSVYDYDGLNHRTLTQNTSSHFPVAISRNRWLYYFSDDELIREIIAN